jgi:hypothetical protein
MIDSTDSNGGSPHSSTHWDSPTSVVGYRSPTSLPRISVEAFLAETKDDEQSALRDALNVVLCAFIDMKQVVYLEGFGLLLPADAIRRVSETTQQKLLLREELQRTVQFEKCDELLPMHSERYGSIADVKVISRAVYPRLPRYITWTERDTLRYLKGLILWIKSEVVVHGHSYQLYSLGDLYSLLNRQGSSVHDWFAGADIFLKPRYTKRLQIRSSRVFDRPVLCDSWEPLQAECGKPVATSTLNLYDSLREYGVNVTPLKHSDALSTVSIAEFSRRVNGKRRSVFCTNGLRDLSAKAIGSGHEVIVQLDVDTISNATASAWARYAISLGIAQLHGLSTLGASCPTICTDITNVVVTKSKILPAEQLSANCPFSYYQSVGVTPDEAVLSIENGLEYILSLLEHRGAVDTTRLNRSSVVAKTSHVKSAA